MKNGLGRRPLPDGDTAHLEKYPIRQLLPTTVTPVERTLALPYHYRPKYDQGSEGACVGFASSWMMSILNRRFYDAPFLYHEAQKIDEWEGTDYSGTSVRAGMEVLRSVGHKFLHDHPHEHAPLIEDGIHEYRWATTVAEVRTCIAAGVPLTLGIDWMSAFDTPVRKSDGSYWIGEGDLGRVRGGHAIACYGASDRRQAVKLTNSWGKSWPLVWMPYATLQRLLDGIAFQGECAIVTDRIGATV
ncbi:MAG: hypothetical protein M3440_13095 [Chloroflexota bacterium]|nr:hypothetical protein [Chloroflexota bacterium]